MGVELSKCKWSCVKQDYCTAYLKTNRCDQIEINNEENNDLNDLTPEVSHTTQLKFFKYYSNQPPDKQIDSRQLQKDECMMIPNFTSLLSKTTDQPSENNSKDGHANEKLTKLQSIYKGISYQRLFKSFIKNKLIKEHNEYITVLQEKYDGMNQIPKIPYEYQRNGWKKMYSEEEGKMFKVDDGMTFNKGIIENEMGLYTGELNKNNEKHGYGILIMKNGIKYEGHWKDNIFDGWGRKIEKNGSFSEGCYINGTLNGKGMKQTENGSRYIGDFVNDLGEGNGKEDTCEHIYEGQFKQDKKNGKGMLIFKHTTDVYEGDFIDNNITGEGLYKWANKETFEGSFVNGKMHGKGIYKWIDGEEYSGDYVNNIKEGHGIFKWADGKVYEGLFKRGVPSGTGKIRFGNKEIDATFYHGKIISNIGDLMIQ